jgi:hypothetical protein
MVNYGYFIENLWRRGEIRVKGTIFDRIRKEFMLIFMKLKLEEEN